jgi:hypothetical protein
MKLPTSKQYPKTLVIGDEEYSVKFVGIIRGDKSVLGICDPSSKEILIKKGISAPDKFATLIHEILHAIEAEYEINIPHSLVYKLDHALIDLLLQNF